MKKQFKGTVICGWCDREIGLTKNGLMHTHGPRGHKCSGSNKTNAECPYAANGELKEALPTYLKKVPNIIPTTSLCEYIGVSIKRRELLVLGVAPASDMPHACYWGADQLVDIANAIKTKMDKVIDSYGDPFKKEEMDECILPPPVVKPKKHPTKVFDSIGKLTNTPLAMNHHTWDELLKLNGEELNSLEEDLRHIAHEQHQKRFVQMARVMTLQDELVKM